MKLLVRAAATCFFAAMSVSPAAAVISNVDHADDVCAPTANPCTITQTVKTVNGAILNFGSWSVARDPDHEHRLQIVVDDAAAYPETLCHTTAGFITHMGTKVGDHGLRWFHERPQPGRLVLRMDGDASFAGDPPSWPYRGTVCATPRNSVMSARNVPDYTRRGSMRISTPQAGMKTA